MPKLAPCPDCRRMVSLEAATCLKCGRVFKEGDLIPVVPKPMSPATIIMISVVVLLVIMLLMKGMEMAKEDERTRQRIMDTERRRSGY
jgi:hypothetical protein